MTFCSNCGANIEENQKFCPNCGTRVERAEQSSVSPPPPPPPGAEASTNMATPPPPPPKYNNAPPPPPAGSQSNIPPPKKGILGRVDIDQEDIDEVAEKAKKGLGAAWSLARKGISKGAELAGQGIDVAKETIDDRRAPQNGGQPQQPYQAPPSEGANQSVRFCPNCGQPASPGKFCNHCGHRLE
jgi:ribosomal protein L32